MPASASRILTAVLTLMLVLVADRLQPPASLPADNVRSRSQTPREATTTTPVTAPLPQANPVPGKRRPQVAIIIDDMGYNLETGRQLLQLDMALTFSFLPEAPHTQELARQAHTGGRNILVHLPMEPKERTGKEEQQTLQVGESGEEIQRKIRGMLTAVPFAVGANNHMGSRFTEDRQGMRQVLSCLRTRSLFYIDSLTTAASVGEDTARQLGIPTARRAVFLDNEQRSTTVCRQLGLLAAKAATDGYAIAIGHPNQAMVEALTSCAHERLEGVHLVNAAQLVR